MRNLKFAGLPIIIASLLLLSSCSSGSDDNHNSIKREAITGNWQVTKQSLEAMNSQEFPSTNWPREFQLNNDSTVTLHFDDFKNVVNGQWKWKPDTQLGDSTFAVGISSDLIISYSESETAHRFLGLTVAEDKGKRTLTLASDIIYEQVPMPR